VEIAALVLGSITLVAAITAVVFSVLSWKGGQRAERRDIERNDVSWRIDHPEDGTLVLTNVGRDAACHVLAVVTVNGETSRAEAERISSDESIEIPSKGAAAAHEEAERNDEMERRAAQDTRSSYQPSPQNYTWVNLNAVVTWAAPSGRLEQWAEEQRWAL